MRTRITRLGVMAIGVIALLGGTTPPAARAHTTATITLEGTMVTDGGLGYVFPTLVDDPPEPVLVCDLPLKPPMPDNCHVEWTHHTRGVTIRSGICIIVGANGFNKTPEKQPAFAHACGFFGSGYVSGHCDQMGGQVSMLLDDALGQLYFFDLHLTVLETLATITGHWEKAGDPENHGLIAGELLTAPLPVPGGLGPPTGIGNSCSNKSATAFELIGTLQMIPDLTLLI